MAYNQLINLTQKLVNNFCANAHGYNYDITNPIIPDIIDPTIGIHKDNPEDKKKILKDIATNFVTRNYFEKKKTAENIFLLINDTFNRAITTYCNIKEINESNIKFVAKGGIVLYMIQNKYIDLISNNNIRKLLHNEYDKYFEKSDMDFTIIINKDLDDISFNEIYKDMSDLTYFILYLIRNHIRKFPIKYMDYYKYNDTYKTYLLNTMRTTINKSKFTNNAINNNTYCCKLTHNNNYVEEPCIKNVTFDKEKQYDMIITKLPDNRIQTKYPSQLADKQLSSINDMYISYNNTIEFHNYDRSIYTKFFLGRMKSLFNLYFITNNDDTINCCNFYNIGGEMIDISITHKNSTYIMSTEENLDITQHKIKDSSILFNIPTLDYNIKDLNLMLFLITEYPWDSAKPKKRIYRYIFFILLEILIDDDVETHTELNEIKNILNGIININDEINKYNSGTQQVPKNDCSSMNKIRCKTDSVFFNNKNNKIMERIKELREQLNIHGYNENINQQIENLKEQLYNNNCFWDNNTNSCISSIVPFIFINRTSKFKQLIDNINNIIKKLTLNINAENINKFKEFIDDIYSSLQIISLSIQNIIYQPTDIPPLRAVSGLGLGQKYLSIYKDKYLKYKNKYLGIVNKKRESNLNNQKGGFNTCNKKENFIVPIIVNSFIKLDSYSLNNNINNIFDGVYDKLLNKFNSRNFASQQFIRYDDDDDYISPPFHNYTINISALAFISFMIEYQLFLNLYIRFNPKIVTFNTITNNTRNTFLPIFPGPDNVSRIYRDILNNTNIEELLTIFCKELDRLYSRFMVTLISNLVIIAVDKISADGTVSNYKFEEIRNIIIPSVSLKNKTSDSKYELLYYDWKQRLIDNNIIDTIINIDKVIIKSIDYIEDQSIHSIDNQYTPEATGFFSWMFMMPIKSDNISKKFGSCITSTYLEIYILYRIHEDAKHISIGIQNDNSPHPIWKITERETGAYMSHWTTIWFNLSSGKHHPKIFRNGVFPGSDLQFDNISQRGNINIVTNKKLYLQSLIYPIYDNYIEYANINRINLDTEYDNINREINEAYTRFSTIVDRKL